MSNQSTVKIESNVFARARQIVSKEYNKVTVKSSGKVYVTKSDASNSPKLIIKKSE